MAKLANILQLVRLSADPLAASLQGGELWYNTTENAIKTYDGTIIRTLSYSGGAQSSYFRCENVDIVVDLNSSTGDYTTQVPIVGVVSHNVGSDFQAVGQTVQANFDGDIKLHCVVKILGTGARQSPNIRTRINGTPLGSIGASGYIRNSTGHAESSLHISDIFTVADGDIIDIGSRREGGAGIVTMNPIGGSTLIIERL